MIHTLQPCSPPTLRVWALLVVVLMLRYLVHLSFVSRVRAKMVMVMTAQLLVIGG